MYFVVQIEPVNSNKETLLKRKMNILNLIGKVKCKTNFLKDTIQLLKLNIYSQTVFYQYRINFSELATVNVNSAGLATLTKVTCWQFFPLIQTCSCNIY